MEPAADPRPTILVVEDDTGVASLLADALEAEGFGVRRAATGAAAKRCIAAERPDAILLDLILPDTDGLILCADFRENPDLDDVPILVCSAVGEPRDVLLAFRLGADDFVHKPFRVEELIARLRAALRRAGRGRAAAAPERSRAVRGDDRLPRAPEHRGGNVSLDPTRHQATVGGRPLSLTPSEVQLLHALLQRPGEVVPRAALERAIWGHDGESVGRALDVHIARLRDKLAEAPPPAPTVEVVRGVGYRLVVYESGEGRWEGEPA